MVKIKIPATTANMGAGFDCFGMALNMYNELTVQEAEEFSVEIVQAREGTAKSHLTKDNLIYQTMARFYDEIGRTIPNLKLTQNDKIPIARGLGSSSACIVAGLFAANELTQRPMNKDELAEMACRIEGHPDNVAPAVYGGFVVAVMEEDKFNFVKIKPSDELSFITFIPDFQVPTGKARRILPQEYSRADAIFNISRASLFIASMMSKNWDNLPVSVDDRIHQPYRGKLVPNMDVIFKHAKNIGAKGVFMSGAGPTIIAIALRSEAQKFEKKMKSYLKELPNAWQTFVLDADYEGALIL
ncbi:MAG: homoserine kinase [Defluviitaleaceae bacterium]|nr:homoserine kinase [Defluviitaleaceae bacterium]